MKFKWSHSTLDNLLDGCAWQVYLERFAGLRIEHDHPRAAVGTAYHAALEAHEEQRRLWHYSGGRAGDPDGIHRELALRLAFDVLSRLPAAWTDDYPSVQGHDEVHTAVTHWWDAPIPGGQPGAGGSIRDRLVGWKPVAVESGFTLHTEASARPLRGFPDAIYVTLGRDELDAGTLVVVDHKQAKNFGRYPTDGSKQRLQGAMYARAARDATNLPGSRRRGLPLAEFHISRVLEGSNSRFQPVRVLQVQATDADVELIDRRMGIGDAAVAAGEFPKNPDWFLCKPEWCPHHVEAGGTCTPHAPGEFSIEVAGEPLPVLA